MSAMGIGTSIFLIALGAILKFAVTATVSGIELATVGTILIVVGIIGLLISMMFMMQAGRRGAVVDRGPYVERERVVERDPYV
jgi:sulfite exporter TauE/SafE